MRIKTKKESWEPESKLEEGTGEVKKAKIKGWDHLIGKDFSDDKKKGKIKKIKTNRMKEEDKTNSKASEGLEKLRIKKEKKILNRFMDRMK